MSLFTPAERAFAVALSKLTYSNPFLPERIEYEREALGEEFVERALVWSAQADTDEERPNVLVVGRRAEAVIAAARQRLIDGEAAGREELELYQDMALYLLYHRYREALAELVLAGDGKGAAGRRVVAYARFRDDFENLLEVPGTRLKTRYTPEHVFAAFFQIRRAFNNIFRSIVGSSLPAARLRGAVWQSVFSGDLKRYLRCLYDRMADFTTLIVGPTGTGKELVARAIGLSRYIPFDAKAGAFAEDYSGAFAALNVSALSPTLIESELFGHRRGAFTGALEDRAGWLEVCRPLGTVFLDEVGEIGESIQVKLLRVLQTRQFQRLGDTATRQFLGKLVAATNRDLAGEIGRGRIREDFYYRLCSDMITTPSLREVLADSPDELHNLVLWIAVRVSGPRGAAATGEDQQRAAEEAEGIAREVERWIASHLGRDYAWPGNFRELEQCVRNVLIRGEYRPAAARRAGAREKLADAIFGGTLTADQLLRRYCTIVQAQTGNYEETARRLGIDRRTVKAKIDEGYMAEARGS